MTEFRKRFEEELLILKKTDTKEAIRVNECFLEDPRMFLNEPEKLLERELAKIDDKEKHNFKCYWLEEVQCVLRQINLSYLTNEEAIQKIEEE